jgi:hypothetical protein
MSRVIVEKLIVMVAQVVRKLTTYNGTKTLITVFKRTVACPSEALCNISFHNTVYFFGCDILAATKPQLYVPLLMRSVHSSLHIRRPPLIANVIHQIHKFVCILG